MFACSPRDELGGFEDDGRDGEQGEALPPDLPQSACDPRRTDGCGVDHKCRYVVDPELGPLNRCVPLIGDGIAGDPCELSGDSDSCANHHLCWMLDDAGHGTCVEYCSTALACGDPLALCAVSNDGLLPLCLTRCDPLLQDCPAGQGCYPDDYQRWACDRDQSGQAGEHGDACACLNCCDPGRICLPGAVIDADGCGGDDGAAGCCGDLCMLGEGMDEMCTADNERCEAYYAGGSVQMGYELVGVCRT